MSEKPKGTPRPKMNFDTRLIAFIKHTSASMTAANDCAVLSLIRFKDNGDLSQCQRFLDAMSNTGKNYVRRTAYLKWLAAHSPIKFEGGKLLKDKDEDAVAFNLEAAFSKPFWEFAPDQEEILLTHDGAFEKLMKTIKYFRSAKVKMDDPTKRMVDTVEAAIKQANAAATAAEAVSEGKQKASAA